MFSLAFSIKDISLTILGTSFKISPSRKHYSPAEIHQSNKRCPIQNIIVIYLGIISFLFCGCESKPTPDKVSIRHQNEYVALKSFPLKCKIYNVETGFIRLYIVEDETLSKAGTFYGRKHRFLINSSFGNFKIVRVKQKEIIKYRFIRFKSYVNFNEVKPSAKETSIISNKLFLETELPPGRYLLVPWEGLSPAEPIGYGFVIKSSTAQLPPAETKATSPKKNP
jgi:hypothetical protein